MYMLLRDDIYILTVHTRRGRGSSEDVSHERSGICSDAFVRHETSTSIQVSYYGLPCNFVWMHGMEPNSVVGNAERSYYCKEARHWCNTWYVTNNSGLIMPWHFSNSILLCWYNYSVSVPVWLIGLEYSQNCIHSTRNLWWWRLWCRNCTDHVVTEEHVTVQR